MGLLSKLGLGGTKPEKEARAIAKLQKKLMEKFGPPENRQGAIEELAAMRTDAAFDALLVRYTFMVDPGITDDEEKQRLHSLLIEADEHALPAIKRFIMSRDEVAWPLRALSELVPEFEVVNVLLEALRKAAAEYSRVPEKKVVLLRALEQHRSPEAIAVALPFLEDMADEVQIAAAHVIAAQATAPQGTAPGGPAPTGSEAGREPIIQAFLRAHENSNARVKEALAGILVDTAWDVKGYTPKFEAALPAAYKLDSKARVQRKS